MAQILILVNASTWRLAASPRYPSKARMTYEALDCSTCAKINEIEVYLIQLSLYHSLTHLTRLSWTEFARLG